MISEVKFNDYHKGCSLWHVTDPTVGNSEVAYIIRKFHKAGTLWHTPASPPAAAI